MVGRRCCCCSQEMVGSGAEDTIGAEGSLGRWGVEGRIVGLAVEDNCLCLEELEHGSQQ